MLATPVGSLGWEVGKILWRREWQPTPVFFAWEIPWREEPEGLQSMWLATQQQQKNYAEEMNVKSKLKFPI